MMFIPPPPSSRQVGRKLGKLLATMRKLQTAAKPPPATPKHNMSTPTQRPTPETDEAEINLGSACGQFSEWYVKPDFARKIERERDEAREELQAMRDERNQLSRDLSSLLAGDCLNGHDAVEGARNGIAMREAIKEVYEALSYVSNFEECRIFCADSMDIDSHAAPMCMTALAKLQPFIKPCTATL